MLALISTEKSRLLNHASHHHHVNLHTPLAVKLQLDDAFMATLSIHWSLDLSPLPHSQSDNAQQRPLSDPLSLRSNPKLPGDAPKHGIVHPLPQTQQVTSKTVKPCARNPHALISLFVNSPQGHHQRPARSSHPLELLNPEPLVPRQALTGSPRQRSRLNLRE